MPLRWFSYCLRNCFDFSGRASRNEYWSFTLINLAVTAALAVVFGYPNSDFSSTQTASGTVSYLSIGESGTPFVVYSLIMIIPAVAVTCRRLHDRDHTGWWVFWACILPILNLVILVFCLLPSEERENRYAPRAPKSPDDVVSYPTAGTSRPQNTDRQPEALPSNKPSVPSEPAEQSVAEAFGKQNERSEHRPTTPAESELVGKLKKLSGK